MVECYGLGILVQREEHIGYIISVMKNGKSRQSSFIGEYTRIIMVLYQKDVISIIKMGIQRTILLKILRHCHQKSTVRQQFKSFYLMKKEEIKLLVIGKVWIIGKKHRLVRKIEEKLNQLVNYVVRNF